MTVLLIVGVGVVILGALVLLRFPDRPGGTITWQGVEVSSVGAGLPLIVIGVAAIAVAGGGIVGDGGGTTPSQGQPADQAAALACPDDLAERLPTQRVATVEAGASGQVVAGQAASKTEPFGLTLTDQGTTVGAMTVRYFPASKVFKVQSVVDAECETGQVESISQPGVDLAGAIPNAADVRLNLGRRSYTLNLNASSDLRVNFGPFVP